MTKAFLLLTCLLISHGLFAQLVYEGSVVDNITKEPLEAISVGLLRSDSMMIGYTYTNEKGNFKVVSPENKEAVYISFTSMGYKTKILLVKQFRNSTIVSLENTPIQIREVKITSNRIKQNHDTLSYSISGFRMPQDRSIEDVLKKMPGIEVTESGAIKFQDKLINKFYIEGMDLLDGKYTLASRNMSPNMVKEVQVLQSHQPVAALRGNTFSENAALNLILTEDARLRLIGSVNLGLGWNEQDKDLRWDNRILGMIFDQKMQNLSMYKNNNTGKDIKQEINPLIPVNLFKTKNKHEESDFFSSPQKTTIDIDQSRYLFNDTHLATINHLYKPSKPIDLRLQISALHDEMKFSSYNATSYFYPDNIITINEEERSETQHNKLQGGLTFQLNDTSIYIRNALSGEIGLDKKWYDIQINKEVLNQHIRPERRNIQNNFELIRKLRKYSYSIYSDNSYFDLPQEMSVSPGLYQELLNGDKSYLSFRQIARLRSFQSHTYSYFQHKIAGFYIKYNVGILHLNQKMYSALELVDETYMPFIPGNNYQNDLNFRQTQLYFEPVFNYKNYRWDIQFHIPLSLHTAKLKVAVPAMVSLDKQRCLISPSTNIKYDINAYWTVSGMSNYSHLYTDIMHLYAGCLFTSYRSTSAYIPDLGIQDVLSNAVSIRFSSPLSGFFTSFHGFYNILWNDVMYEYRNNDILSWAETVYKPHNNTQWSIGTRSSKTFSWWKLYTAMSANYNVQENKLLLESQKINSVLKSINLAFEFSIQPNQYVNVQGESQLLSIYSTLDYPGYDSKNVIHYNNKVGINILPDAHWRIKWNNSVSHNKGYSRQLTYFADISVSYVYKKTEIQLIGNNIFNNNSFERTYLNDFTETFIHYSLRPREFMAKILFSF
jgi:hypothetical protein